MVLNRATPCALSQFSRCSIAIISGAHARKYSVIDDVTPGDICILADDLGLAHPLMRSIAADPATKITPSLQSAATALNTQGHTMAPYIADEMKEDIEPRRLILENI